MADFTKLVPEIRELVTLPVPARKRRMLDHAMRAFQEHGALHSIPRTRDYFTMWLAFIIDAEAAGVMTSAEAALWRGVIAAVELWLLGNGS